MSYATFINLLSIAIGFVAALYFGLGSAFMSQADISKVSGTMWDENPHFAAFLRTTKAEYRCGSIALCAAFALQFVANVPNLLPSGEAFSSTFAGAVFSLVISSVFGGVLWFWRGVLRARLAPKP